MNPLPHGRILLLPARVGLSLLNPIRSVKLAIMCFLDKRVRQNPIPIRKPSNGAFQESDLSIEIGLGDNFH